MYATRISGDLAGACNSAADCAAMAEVLGPLNPAAALALQTREWARTENARCSEGGYLCGGVEGVPSLGAFLKNGN